ncbi:MAG: ABC transporter ATP-binding protein [Granulosicoccus sp.]
MSESALNEPVVSFQQVSKHYGDVVGVNNLSLDIKAGEFLSLLGPSGCGKTTSLRMIAGFEQPTIGTIQLAGKAVNGIPAYKRPVNMVFQHYALFPHKDVASNVAYGLKQIRPRLSKADIEKRVAKTLEQVRLAGYQHRRIWELSGGQQQRVALARALINEPQVLLLDEPLAALDRKLRHEMQIELQTLQRTVGITFVLVTHDQEEALSMSDRVCLMRDGGIVQIGTPIELYDKPDSRYVADFVGRSNFFPGSVTGSDNKAVNIALTGGMTLSSTNRHNKATFSRGEQVVVCVRPEQLKMSRSPSEQTDADAICTDGLVLNRIFLGEHTEYLLSNEKLGDILLLAPRQNELTEPPLNAGEYVYVTCSRDSALVINAD